MKKIIFEMNDLSNTNTTESSSNGIKFLRDPCYTSNHSFHVSRFKSIYLEFHLFIPSSKGELWMRPYAKYLSLAMYLAYKVSGWRFRNSVRQIRNLMSHFMVTRFPRLFSFVSRIWIISISFYEIFLNLKNFKGSFDCEENCT